MKKYAIHPGSVISYYDGELHYIGYSRLISLYQLSPNECILWDVAKPETTSGRVWSDYIHLYPRTDSHYYKERRLNK